MTVRGSQGSPQFLNMLSALPMFQPAQSDATSVASAQEAQAKAAEEARLQANMPLKLRGRDGGGVQVNFGCTSRYSANSSVQARSYSSIFAQKRSSSIDQHIAESQQRLASQGVNLYTLT